MSYQQPPNSQPFGYPPTPEQSPKKRNASWIWLIVGLLIGFGIGYAAHVAPATSTPTTPTVQATTQDTATVESQPTSVPTPATNRVGAPVTSGIWQLTINSAKTSNGDEFDTPKAGNIYLLVDFTAKNTAASAQDMSPNYFAFRDNQGITYDLAYITVPSEPRGTVVAGQQLRGDLSYEIPKSLHSFVLQFDPPEDTDGSQIVQWTISVK